MNYKIAQFILTPPQRGQTLEIYVAQPDAAKEALAGKIFALIEIPTPKPEYLKVANFLINALNHDYYQNEKMILRERVDTVRVEHIFESALAKTNKKLAEFLQAEKIKLHPEELNITIGVVYADGLHFSNLGKNKALLIYKNKAEAGGKYKLADVTASTESAESKKPVSPTKLFANVVSGAVPRGGYFIFAGEALSEYLSNKQLLDIVTTLPPAGAAEQIKNTLAKINAYVPFLGLIIKNTAGLAEKEEVKTAPAPATTRASIADLNTTEARTEKLLTPSGLVKAKKWPAALAGLAGAISPKPAAAGAFRLKDKIFAKRRTLGQSVYKIFAFLKNLLVWLAGALIFLFKFFTDRQAMSAAYARTVAGAKAGQLKIKQSGLASFFWYKNLNRAPKILFSAFLICLALFSANLIWRAVENGQAKKQAAYGALASSIEQKQNQIDASLLYNNEAGAKKLLDEVAGLLTQLPQKSGTQKDLYNQLAAKQRVQLEKVSRVIRAQPVELANFSNLNAAAAPASLILSRGKLYAAGGQAIFSLDPAAKIAAAVNPASQNLTRLDFPALDKNNNVYYLTSTGLKMLDAKSEKLSDLTIDYTGDLSRAADLEQYNGRFYLIDKAGGQIYRFAKNETSLAGATAWLNQAADLSKAVGLAIDGEVYVLASDGQLTRYTKGAKQTFSLAAVTPSLASADKLWLSPEGDYLYVLDATGRRLVVFKKDGAFVEQYALDGLTGLKDFQVDESAKKIYLLAGASVYSLDLVEAK